MSHGEVESGLFQLLIEEVSVEDAGSYQCMIGKVEDGEFIKDTRTISVEVATEADIQFGEDVDTSEEAFVMLKDQVKRRKCDKIE